MFTNTVEILGMSVLHAIIQVGFPASCESCTSLLCTMKDKAPRGYKVLT